MRQLTDEGLRKEFILLGEEFRRFRASVAEQSNGPTPHANGQENGTAHTSALKELRTAVFSPLLDEMHRRAEVRKACNDKIVQILTHALLEGDNKILSLYCDFCSSADRAALMSADISTRLRAFETSSTDLESNAERAALFLTKVEAIRATENEGGGITGKLLNLLFPRSNGVLAKESGS